MRKKENALEGEEAEKINSLLGCHARELLICAKKLFTEG